MKSSFNLINTILATALIILLSTFNAAQVRTTYDAGAAGLGQMLRRLQTTASAMHVAAHPDDEDSALIARLTRGDGARVAYLSLTRGEGGQNIISRDLFEALGVIRTEELLQARRLDGGTQLFTRAMDFGFTKTRAETAEKWSERELLEDMVRAIRSYRPLIVFSRFSGTGADGHGQHQMAGYLAPLAFRAAADPNAFPEQFAEGLRPWRARKFYIGRFGAGGGEPKSIRVETGLYDALLGRTYFQIAMEGRSQHKSQEMGREEWLGPQGSVLQLIESTTDTTTERERSLFDGIDTSISGIASVSNLRDQNIKNLLAEIDKKAKDALAGYDAFTPGKIISPLAEGLTLTRQAREKLSASSDTKEAKADADFLLELKVREFSEALRLAAGVNIDALSDTEIVAPGESFNVAARVFLTDEKLAQVKDIKLRTTADWTVTPLAADAAPQQQRASFYGRETPTTAARYRLSVPANASPTQPYWLERPRSGYLFQWPENAPKTRAVNVPLAVGEFTLQIGGVNVVLQQPVEYRFGDHIRGELRRDVNVAPALTVTLDPARVVLPLARQNAKQRLAVRLTSNSQQPMTGTLSLQLPAGWSAEPASAPYALKAKGERTALIFDLVVPTQALVGDYPVKALATSADGRKFDQSERTIAYPHIQTHRLYSTAQTNVEILDLRVAPVRVGYIMGSGDDVPEAIKQMGLSVTMLDENELSAGELSRFDVIVVGVRASEVRPDLVSNNERLLDYVRGGGTLIVQYQQYDYVSRQLAPFPAEMASRVTDETAAVTILQPAHPIFNFPNKITAADWNNWVQERSLYNFTTFDAAYQPLLESHDPGEGPQKGGELYAQIGRGHYIYTSYAWFRQLPAGVPGAYRLFANLLSLAKAPTTKSDNLPVKSK